MMGLTSTIVRAILAAAIISPVLAINENEFAPDDVIIRDVCILGGGATGTYAAVSLKDKAKSVVVVERHGILGGHTETLYTDNDQYVDYGVEGLFDNELSRNYFNRLGIDYKLLLPNTLVNQYVDFKTGKKVSPPAGLLDAAAAAVLYRTAIQKYSYLQDGLYNLPDPVPDELLRPFSEFVEETGIQGACNLFSCSPTTWEMSLRHPFFTSCSLSASRISMLCSKAATSLRKPACINYMRRRLKY